MKNKKGLESVVTLIPWIVLAVIFIALVILFVTHKFNTIGDLMRRILPVPV